jgi:hypothetical protein
MVKPRGRPKALTFEFCQDLWVRIEFLRIRYASPGGRPASVRRVAITLAENGGVVEIVGGNREILAVCTENLNPEDGRDEP